MPTTGLVLTIVKHAKQKQTYQKYTQNTLIIR